MKEEDPQEIEHVKTPQMGFRMGSIFNLAICTIPEEEAFPILSKENMQVRLVDSPTHMAEADLNFKRAPQAPWSAERYTRPYLKGTVLLGYKFAALKKLLILSVLKLGLNAKAQRSKRKPRAE